MLVVVDTQWEFVPEDQRQGVDLVQTGSVSTVTGESMEAAGITGAAQQDDVRNSGLADLLIGRYVLAFEAVSVLLLAALIGALALVRPNQREGESARRAPASEAD